MIETDIRSEIVPFRLLELRKMKVTRPDAVYLLPISILMTCCKPQLVCITET
jgi:hypothetical protein